MSTRSRTLAGLGLALLLGLGLVGCSNGDDAPESDPPSTETPAPDDTTTEPGGDEPSTDEPEPETPVSAMPADCEALIPLEEVKANAHPDFEPVEAPADLNNSFVADMGPAASQAVTGADQTMFCAWGIPQTDGLNAFLIAELSDEVKETLITELRSSDFVESELDGAPVFTYTTEPSVGPAVSWYAFSDNVWIAGLVNSEDGGLGPLALEGVRG